MSSPSSRMDDAWWRAHPALHSTAQQLPKTDADLLMRLGNEPYIAGFNDGDGWVGSQLEHGHPRLRRQENHCQAHPWP